MKKVLVTGGAGYIGSHTVKALHQQGYHTIVFDNLVYGHKDFVHWGEFFLGDLLDEQSLDRVFECHRDIESVVHFAAYAYVGESVTNPEKYYRNNICGSLNLFTKAKDHGVRKAIFSSTCATYGIPNQVPISEDHSQMPINPYGYSKLVIEQLLKDFDTAYGLKSVILRYFNACGADPEPLVGQEIGEDHDPETHLIPLILDTALGRKDFIGIYGTDYPTADGSAIRDYVHVCDLADAHVLALKHLEQGRESDVFNLGNGLGYSVRAVIESAKKIVGKQYPIRIKDEPRRAGDPPELVGSSAKAKEVLGWKPRFENIDEIMAHAWRWHQNRFKK